MPELPWSYLARRIINNYLNDKFNLVIVEGKPRVGKSAYISKVLGQVHDYLWGNPLSVDLLKTYMGWKPDEVSDQWDNMDRREPLYIWDDGGCWLFALDYHDPLLKEFQRYFNIIGTDFNTIAITTPDVDWVLKKIGTMPGVIYVRVIDRDGSDELVGILPPSKRYSRLALIYKGWKSADRKKRGVETKYRDKFSCKFPDEVYDYYFPKRQHYNKLIKKALREATFRRKIRGNELNKVENVLDQMPELRPLEV